MLNKRERRKKIETWLAVIAILLIVVALFIGGQLENEDVVSSIKAAMPEVSKLVEINKATYSAYNPENEILGYITIESSMGYGGPLQMAVAVDQKGKIYDLAVIGSKETPTYLEKVLGENYLDEINGKSYKDKFSLSSDVDGVSGATYSSRAILEASKKGNKFVAAKVLNLDVPKEETPAIQFGGPEIILILLFAVGYFAHKKTFKYTKIARWGTMLVGLFVIGFYYSQPLSLSLINQLLLGYFPPIHSHLYWYLMLGGVFFVLTIDNKNPYCYWFCPFGTAQECLGIIGGAKNRTSKKIKDVFKWSLRIISFVAIIIALLLRNPGVTSYEVFGTLFKLTGSNYQFAILGIVLVLSMFIKRPWCNYLCPLKPVGDNLINVSSWISSKWKRKKIAA